MKLLTVLLVIVFVTACHKHIRPGCDTPATVIDLSASGCGFGFKLADGTVLVPDQHPQSCGHSANPLLNFQLLDSMKVNIGYISENHHNTSCATGKVVEITCITAVNSD